MKKFWILKIGFFVIAGFLLLGLVVMGLWNWLVPVLFHGPFITFFQAIGLLVLSRILFRGFCGMKGGRHGWKGAQWKEKMEKMTPEERERMRMLWKQRCNWSGDKFGSSPPPTEKTTDA